ncbi:MAG: hypothetical protein JWQ66_2934 [Mucilaginibacter sp.]|nr:hypothetical protein [Mucilaginibacter sp.]
MTKLNNYTEKNKLRLPVNKGKAPKSIFDYSPFELSQIDNFQTLNRGFMDEDDNIGIGHDSDYFWED